MAEDRGQIVEERCYICLRSVSGVEGHEMIESVTVIKERQ